MKTKYYYYVALWSDNNGRAGYVNALQSEEGTDHFLLHVNRKEIAKKFNVPYFNVSIINHMEITKEEAETFIKEAML